MPQMATTSKVALRSRFCLHRSFMVMRILWILAFHGVVACNVNSRIIKHCLDNAWHVVLKRSCCWSEVFFEYPITIETFIQRVDSMPRPRTSNRSGHQDQTQNIVSHSHNSIPDKSS